MDGSSHETPSFRIPRRPWPRCASQLATALVAMRRWRRLVMVRMGPPISSVVLATVASVSAEHQVNHRRPLEPRVLTTHFPRRRKIQATLRRQRMPKAARHTAYNRAALKLVSNPSSAPFVRHASERGNGALKRVPIERLE